MVQLINFFQVHIAYLSKVKGRKLFSPIDTKWNYFVVLVKRYMISLLDKLVGMFIDSMQKKKSEKHQSAPLLSVHFLNSFPQNLTHWFKDLTYYKLIFEALLGVSTYWKSKQVYFKDCRGMISIGNLMLLVLLPYFPPATYTTNGLLQGDLPYEQLTGLYFLL